MCSKLPKVVGHIGKSQVSNYGNTMHTNNMSCARGYTFSPTLGLQRASIGYLIEYKYASFPHVSTYPTI